MFLCFPPGCRFASHWRRSTPFQTTNYVTSHFSPSQNQEKRLRKWLHVPLVPWKWLLLRSPGSWQILYRVTSTAHLQLVSILFLVLWYYFYLVWSIGKWYSTQ